MNRSDALRISPLMMLSLVAVSISSFLVLLTIGMGYYSDGILFFSKAFLIFLIVMYFLISWRVGFDNYDIVTWYVLLFCLFLVSRIALDLFGGFTRFGEVRFFVAHGIYPEDQLRTVLNLCLALSGLFFGAALYLKYGGRPPARYIHNTQVRLGLARYFPLRTLRNYGIAVMVLGAIIQLPFAYKTLSFVAKVGYVALHQGALGGKPISVFLAEQLFVVGFVLFVCGRPSHRLFLLNVSFLVLPIIFMVLLAGKRGASMTQLLLILIIWVNLYGKKLKAWLQIFLIVAILNSMVFIGNSRHGRDGHESQTPWSQTIVSFLNGQGASIHTLVYAIMIKEDSNLASDFTIINLVADVRLLFEKFGNQISGRVALTLPERMEKYGYSGYVVTHMAAVVGGYKGSLLNEGKSLGTAFVTEMFLLGSEFAVFFGHGLLGFILVWMSISLRRGLYWPLIIILLPDLLFLARGSIGALISQNIGSLMIIGILYAIAFMQKKSLSKNGPYKAISGVNDSKSKYQCHP